MEQQVRTDLRYWLTEWCERGRTGVSDSRMRADKTRIEKYLLPKIGKRSVARLGRSDIEKWISTLQGEGVGNPTIHATLLCLRQALSMAAERGVIAENPARGVQVIKETIRQPQPDEILSEEQVQAIVKNADPNYQAMILFAARTGAKWEECVGLTVPDLHLEAGMASVGRLRVAEVNGRIVYGEDSVAPRLVELTPDLVDALREYLAETKTWRTKDWDWVFLTKRDHRHPLRPNFNNFTWRPALEAAGLDARSYTFHALRHTAAVHMILERGWEADKIARALGHSSTATTRRIYKRFFLERAEREAAAKKSA